MGIVLSDDTAHDGVQLSEDHVVVVPISGSRTAVQNQNLLLSHVPLKAKNNSFLQKDSYTLVHQPITIPKHWLIQRKYKGEVYSEEMEYISLGLLISIGCSDHVQNMINEAVTQAIKEYESEQKGKGETASSNE